MLTPVLISLMLFKALIIMGMTGTLILGLTITAYTVYEFRQEEIW